MKYFRFVAAMAVVTALVLWILSRCNPLDTRIRFETEEIEQLAFAAGKWMAAETPSEKSEALEAMEAVMEEMREDGRPPLEAVRPWWKVFSHRYYQKGDRGPGTAQKADPSEIADGDPSLSRRLIIPPSCSPHRPTPLIVCLLPDDRENSASGSPGRLESLWPAGEVQDRFILLAIKGMNRAQKSSRTVFNTAADLIGEEVLSRCTIDRNRIFLDSFGDSTAVAWQVAGRFADVFAGVIIRGGLPPEGTLFDDFLNTPFLLISVPEMPLNPSTAPAIVFKMKEAGVKVTTLSLQEPLEADRKEEAFQEIAPDLIRFLEKSRNPYPNIISWNVKGPACRRSFWIQSTGEFDHPDPERNLVLPGFQANVNLQFNQVLVTAHRIKGLKFELNDDILDLDEPVRIVVNGKEVFREHPDRSLKTLLRIQHGSRNWTRISPFQVSVENLNPR